jgi:hypothetical protein
MDIEHIAVENINGGRLALHINEQIKRLIADVIDPNKPATAKRTLQVTIDVLPSKSRREAKVSYGLGLKLAAPAKEEAYINIGRVGGEPFASNQLIEEQPLPFQDEQDGIDS